MLRSHQGSAPAHTSLQRAKDESANTDSHVDLATQPSSVQPLFWSSSDLPSLSASAPEVDATPKTGSHLYLDNLSATSCADLLQAGIDSLDPDLATPSDILDNNVFAPSNNSGCQSSPAMSATSNYNFETPSLHHVSALATPFTTSSPNVGSVGTGDENSAKTSPTQQHEQGWYHAGSHDRKPGFDGGAESSFQAPYPHKSVYQAQQAQQAHHSDHEYYSHGAQHPGVSQYFQQRASISGPLMDSAPYPERYESSVATHAPPRVHGLAAWENASGSARPHTADGMFGQFGGVAGAGVASQHEASMALGSSASSSRLHTPTPHSSQFDAYHRRMSMPDGGASSKVFSYMASGDDGGAAGINMGSQFGGHYFGSGYGGASKKRPRRRYDEIERLYPCSWSGCTKSYGTLNHLNAHVAMQKHGPKRSPGEFKDMRKAWRKQKKEEEQQRQSRQGGFGGSSSYAPAQQASEALSSGNGGHASNLPLAPPPALSAFGSTVSSNSNTSLPGIGQLPGSMAHLGRYSMSSVSAAPTNPSAPAQAPFPFYGTTTTDSALHSNMHYASDTARLPYSSAGQHHSIGAYLAAHRGSI